MPIYRTLVAPIAQSERLRARRRRAMPRMVSPTPPIRRADPATRGVSRWVPVFASSVAVSADWVVSELSELTRVFVGVGVFVAGVSFAEGSGDAGTAGLVVTV